MRTTPISLTGTLFVAAASVIVVGCGSKELSRDNAAALIEKSPKFRQNLTVSETTPGVAGVGVTYIAESKVAKVTGIRSEDPTSATAEFIWQWQPTKRGKELGWRGTYDASPETTHNAVATFRKYDDGWRVMEVNGDLPKGGETRGFSPGMSSTPPTPATPPVAETPHAEPRSAPSGGRDVPSVKAVQVAMDGWMGSSRAEGKITVLEVKKSERDPGDDTDKASYSARVTGYRARETWADGIDRRPPPYTGDAHGQLLWDKNDRCWNIHDIYMENRGMSGGFPCIK